MNELAILIITAFVNAAVTGVISNLVFLRYKTEIENSFAQSLFEYQTKFVRNHEKMVVALDTIYKKYAALLRACRDFMSQNEHENDNPHTSTVVACIADMSDYFNENRIYLPTDVEKTIQTIVNDCWKLIIIHLPLYGKEITTKLSLIANNGIVQSKLNIRLVGTKPEYKAQFASDIRQILADQEATLKALYKSAAETKS